MKFSNMLRSLCVGLCLALAAAPALAGPAPSAPKAGDMAPNVVGKTLEGEVIEISQHAGKVVALTFWATWCPYCLKELPILEAIQNAPSAAGQLQVIAVNTEERAVFRKVLRHLESFKMKLAYDPGKVGQDAYGVKGIPHLAIIGRDGRIIRVHTGYGESSVEEILADINQALATPVAAAQAGKPAAAQ